MEKVERYIYAVIKRLPEKQRNDIEKELRGLIEDMLGNRTRDREATDGDIEAVLLELGDPAELADQYRGKKKYLIGPDNFDTYLLVLKIVIAAVAFGITLATLIAFFVTPPESVIEIIAGYFGSLISALFQGFAWVTIVFALIEHFEVPIGKEMKEEEWSPSHLPMLPDKEAAIKPSEAIFGIIFAVLAVIIFNTAEHLIGIYTFSDGTLSRVIPLFDLDTFRSVLPLLNIMLAVGITKELLKLAIGKWNQGLALSNLALNLVSFGLFAAFITTGGLWNDAFFVYWVDIGLIPAGADPLTLWNRAITGLIIVVALALLIDSIVNLVKGFKAQGSR